MIDKPIQDVYSKMANIAEYPISMKKPQTDGPVQRAYILLNQRDRLLRIPAQEALEQILEDPQPAALVHSFAEQDFYFLVHDLGPENSLTLLKLASLKQWEYLLDMDCWSRDRISQKPMAIWLESLFKADPERLMEWFLKEKTEFFELYFFRCMEIVLRSYDQDPSEIDDRFMTLDDLVYFRFVDDPVLNQTDPEILELRNTFLRAFVNRLADHDFMTFQKVLLEILHVIPAESEEEAYRCRNVRLAEKGFVPFEEAVGIYQPLRPDGIRFGSVRGKNRNTGLDLDRAMFFNAPLSPSQVLEPGTLFSESLQELAAGEVPERIQVEFAALCNQMIVADRKIVTDREHLAQIVKKACAVLSIGIDVLAQFRGLAGNNRGAAVLAEVPVVSIFRVGVGKAHALKHQARQWRKGSWFESAGLPLTFWDEAWLGVLGGLLIKRPLYFDNFKTGVIYREFSCLREIDETRQVLSDITAVDGLLSLMDIGDLAGLPQRWLTYKNLLLTAWCREESGLLPPLAPVSVTVFQRFSRQLFEENASVDTPGKTRIDMKSRFLNWLAGRSGLDIHEIGSRLGKIFEALFEEIEAECGGVDPEHIDPRYVRLFLLEHDIGG